MSMHSQEAAWNMWVIVYGFYPSSYNKDMVLQRFMQYGDIDNHLATGGNWMFIKCVFVYHSED